MSRLDTAHNRRRPSDPSPSAQLLLISTSPELAELLRKILPVRCRLLIQGEVAQAKETIRLYPNIPIVAEYAPESPDANSLSLLLHGHASSNAVLIGAGTDEQNLGFLFEHPGLLNLIPKQHPQLPRELRTILVKKFGGKTIWGVRHYLKPDARFERLRLYSFSNHGTILMTLSQHLAQIRAYKSFSDRVQTIATELMMNAVLDAHPRENVRIHRRKLHHRNQGIKLAKSEEVHVEFGYDDERFVISTSDNHGMLREADALQRLYRCTTLGGSQMRMTENRGAGVGFFMMYNWCSQLAFNISQGNRTEAICVLSITKREKFATPESRALNFFRGRGT